jgi:hypothetical protein
MTPYHINLHKIILYFYTIILYHGYLVDNRLDWYIMF